MLTQNMKRKLLDWKNLCRHLVDKNTTPLGQVKLVVSFLENSHLFRKNTFKKDAFQSSRV